MRPVVEIIVAVAIVSWLCLQWSVHEASPRQKLAEACADGYVLAGEGAFTSSGPQHLIFVFESPAQQWPGPNPEVIVLADRDCNVLDIWKSEPESMFLDLRFEGDGASESLVVRRAMRPGLNYEIVRYGVYGETIHEISRHYEPPMPPNPFMERRSKEPRHAEPGVGADSR